MNSRKIRNIAFTVFPMALGVAAGTYVYLWASKPLVKLDKLTN